MEMMVMYTYRNYHSDPLDSTGKKYNTDHHTKIIQNVHLCLFVCTVDFVLKIKIIIEE